MTPLRQRMIEDLRIRNYAPGTIEVYVRLVARFAAFHRRSSSANAADGKTGLRKNDPTDLVLGSSGFSTMDFRRRRSSTASRTRPTATPGLSGTGSVRPPEKINHPAWRCCLRAPSWVASQAT